MNSPRAKRLFALIYYCLLTLLASPADAETVLVAVASNFSSTAKKITEQFELQTAHQVTLAFGSTGQHYAQILGGAPYDVYLAADELRPALLEESGIAVHGSRFTYALGQLVLWSTNSEVDPDRLAQGNTYDYLAIANPRFAPYGAAAAEVLESLGLTESTSSKIVMGENAVQTFQFVQSGSAQLGFVSLAQLLTLPSQEVGFYWRIEPSYYQPIRQQAVLLSENQAAQEFVQFLQADTARQIITSAGYLLE